MNRDGITEFAVHLIGHPGHPTQFCYIVERAIFCIVAGVQVNDPFAKYEEYSTCPSQIPLKDKVGGLSIIEKPTTKGQMSSMYYPVVEGKSADEIIVTGPAKLISTERGGGWTDFLCFEGRWYYRVIH